MNKIMVLQTESQHCREESSGEIKKGKLDLPEIILSAFGRFTQSSADPEFLIDQYHHIVSWNPAMEELTGIMSRDVVGTQRDSWKDLYGTKRPSLADLLVDGRTGDFPGSDRYDRSDLALPPERCETTVFFPHQGPAGRWLHFTASAIKSPAGHVIGAVETVSDITDQKCIERDLALTRRKLRLMNDMAWHEIQNKVTGIRGYVELSKDMVRKDIDMTCIEAEEEVLRQIHELLQCTREYQEIGSLPHCWIGVRDTIRMAVSLLDQENLRVNPDVENLELFADPAFKTMISHLLRYSSKRGTTPPEIRVSYIKKSDSLSLIYNDNGPGIPEAGKSTLFPSALLKYENFCMIFIHDVLEFSGMSIEETGDRDGGIQFVISVPKDRYRFV